MAAPSGTEDLAVEPASQPHSSEVERLLQEHPGRFEFFQAVRLLMRFSEGLGKPGYFIDPEDEAVRFAAEPLPAFPPNTIGEIRWEGDTACLRVAFMGLTGPSGIHIRTQKPLAIYVPSKRLQLWETGRSEHRIAAKVARHP